MKIFNSRVPAMKNAYSVLNVITLIFSLSSCHTISPCRVHLGRKKKKQNKKTGEKANKVIYFPQ
jgi:hypothetical protein